MTEIDYNDDDALRFVQRVLESDAPGADKKAARDRVVEIRTRVLKARTSKPAAAPATAPDRHAQELLAQDITIANMEARHAQELCAYQITVDKLRAERKPMTDIETLALFDRVKVGMLFTVADESPFAAGVEAAEHFHGIKGKT
jgi:hypothetical protein